MAVRANCDRVAALPGMGSVEGVIEVMEKKQTLLFADAVGWQKCECNPEHGEYNPHAYYNDYEIECMMLEDGYILCPFCLVEIAGVYS